MAAQDSSRHPCVLVVDDHPGGRSEVAESLQGQGLAITVATDVAEMDRLLERWTPDIIMLDLISPLEELSVCRRLASGHGPAVIIVSEVASERDKTIALEFGADHLVSRPFGSRDLLARVRSVLRRTTHSRASADGVYSFLGWRFDLSTRELTDPGGSFVKLSPSEFNLLRAFVERPRQVLSREELLGALHGPNSAVSERMIDIQISRMRRKLKGDEFIRTVRDAGYMFLPQVERIA